MLLEVGQTYAGRYRIAKKLGEGAMGAVYEAEHLLIHKRVALKVLLPRVASRRGARDRFEREAQAAGRIGSPHIVEVLDLGDLATGDAGEPSRFIVMELLEGETLADRVKRREKLSAEEAATLACQVLAGLGAAHAADIVHRDLKPSNVFLVRARNGTDFVKVLDFGVSKFSPTEDMATTTPGTAIGTPHFMSPEQAKGAERVDARSDLYALGVILYQCVSGHVPFDGGTLNEVIFRIVLEAPPKLASVAPEVDAAFVAIVEKAMAREPSERFSSARAMAEALAAWLTGVTGKPTAPGIVPWTEEDAFVPASRDALSGASPTEMFERAPTLIREPARASAGAGRSLGLAMGVALLVVIAAATAILVLARPDPDRQLPPRPSASAAMRETPKPVASSTSAAPVVSAAPVASSAAAPRQAPPPSKKPAPAATVEAPQGRTVPSDL